MKTPPADILMVEPIGYRIAYAINPHMLDAGGKLKKVDFDKARAEWQVVHDLYVSLGLRVHVIAGNERYPDMVFCANQTFPYQEGRKPAFVMAQMGSVFRQGEVPLFAQWAKREGVIVKELSTQGSFEGCGDAIWNFATGEVFGGYGFRTDRTVYAELEHITGKTFTLLELKDARFYHLDTCFVVLNSKMAAYVPDAFQPEGIEILKSKFATLIEIKSSEAIGFFAGNAFCPDGKNVILQKGATEFCASLREHGFIVHEVETSEYLKAGGSVFCMKQQFWK